MISDAGIVEHAMNEPLLHNKCTIIYGAGGGIGAGVAPAFAREGARLFLAGRTREPLERVADRIAADGAAPRSRSSTPVRGVGLPPIWHGPSRRPLSGG